MSDYTNPLFADRHIGPDSDAIAAMLEVIGVDSLEELARRARARRDPRQADRHRRRARPGSAAPAGQRGRGAGRAAGAGRRQHRRGVDDRAGLLRHAHAAGAAAQHHGEPGLVHRLHAVPAGDQPGPAGGAAELPDHGRRPDRSRSGQRIDARRGHRGRRGDDADAPRGARGAPTGWRSTSTCSPRPPRCWPPAPSRWASRSSPPTCATACRTASSSVSSRSCPAPAAGSPTGPRWSSEAHDRGALVAVGADLLALTLITPPGEIGADVAFGTTQRFGVPMGFGGPHAGYLAVHTKHARQLPGRLVGVSRRRRRIARLPAGAADPRTAHPSGQGDQQHLHRPGAAGGDGRDVRQLPRRRRAGRHRPAGARPRRDDRRRTRRRAGARHVLRHRAGPGARAAPTRCSPPPRPTASTCGASTTTTCRWPATKRPPTPTWRRSLDGLRRDRPAEPVSADIATRTSEFLTHPAFTRYRTETSMMRYLRALADKDLALGPQHDSARLVHDEAQRRRRDGIDHLAGVRPSASVRARPPTRRVCAG